MDQVKIGKYIASLRRQAGLTQEKLGERLGVTNKTISRWETGTYMPDIEMLGLLARTFDVGIDDLLAGEKTPDEGVRPAQSAAASAFSPEERRAYFIEKRRREHLLSSVLLCLALLAALIVPLVMDRPWLIGAAPLLAAAGYGYQHNRMMIYLERHLFCP